MTGGAKLCALDRHRPSPDACGMGRCIRGGRAELVLSDYGNGPTAGPVAGPAKRLKQAGWNVAARCRTASRAQPGDHRTASMQTQ
jgi:hypothetical protein